MYCCRMNWNLEVLGVAEGGKPENTEKNLWSKDEDQQQTQPTYDLESGNQTQAGAHYPGHIGKRRALSPLHHPCSPPIMCTTCVGALKYFFP